MMSSDAARRLLAAPKRSIRTAKQTLENCQENLQTLGSLLHKSVAADAPAAATSPAVEPVSCCSVCAGRAYHAWTCWQPADDHSCHR